MLVTRKEQQTVARSIRERFVRIFALTLILGSCVFLLSEPELMKVAASSSPKFEAGECVTGNFAFPGEHWVVSHRLDEFVIETYLVEEASGRQQAVEAKRIRRCEESGDHHK